MVDSGVAFSLENRAWHILCLRLALCLTCVSCFNYVVPTLPANISFPTCCGYWLQNLQFMKFFSLRNLSQSNLHSHSSWKQHFLPFFSPHLCLQTLVSFTPAHHWAYWREIKCQELVIRWNSLSANNRLLALSFSPVSPSPSVHWTTLGPAPSTH